MDEPEFIELCRIARRLEPQQRDQLSDWLMEDRLTLMSEEFDNALRTSDNAALDIIFDFETGPFSSTQASD